MYHFSLSMLQSRKNIKIRLIVRTKSREKPLKVVKDNYWKTHKESQL